MKYDYYARFKTRDTKAVLLLVGLSGNAKQRRKTLRAFQRSPSHKGFIVSMYKTLRKYK